MNIYRDKFAVKNPILNTDIQCLEPHLSIFPLGDSAITVELGNRIDEDLNRKALAMQSWLLSLRIPGIRDIIVAYNTVSVFYDPVQIRAGSEDCRGGAFQCMKNILEKALMEAVPAVSGNGAAVRVPVCYGGHFGPDLDWLAGEKGISPEEAIQLHCSRVYRVYMIGFLPGFAYLGGMDERLRVPRKNRPAPVQAGSVGIAGNQTGIYPLSSPGGWQIIGRTSLRLFDPDTEPPNLLKTGDHVQFFPVGPDEIVINRPGET